MDNPQIIQIKKALVDQVANSYRALINALKDIPANPNQKTQAFIFFDTGFLWLKEAIWSVQMSMGDPIQPSQVDNPSVANPDKVDNVDVGEPHPSIPHVPEPEPTPDVP